MKEPTPEVKQETEGQFNLAKDGWYHLAPLGEYPHAESRTVQVLDAPAICSLALRNPGVGAGRGAPDILVDYDHFSYAPDRPSEAAGWITALEARSDGLWGRIRWVPEGAAAVRAGRYRFLSPVWLARDCVDLGPQLSSSGGPPLKRIRPLRLDSVGLTNQPNLPGLAPLSNRQSLPATVVGSPLCCPAEAVEIVPTLGRAEPGNTTERNRMKEIMQVLELAPDATVEAAVSAVRAIQNRVATLARTNAELLTGQVEADLAKYEGRFRPEAREFLRAQLLANRAATIQLIEALQVREPQASGPHPIHNRATAVLPKTQTLQATGDPAGPQRLAIREYRHRHDCTFEQAWAAVRAERPELFQVSGDQ